MCLDDYRRLASALGAPPMFTDLLPLIVRQDEVDLLLRTSQKQLSVPELSELSSMPQAVVQSKVDSLHHRGFLKKTKERHYTARSFQHVISRHLSEGRAGIFGKYAPALAKYRMDEHVTRATADPYPEGRVLPISEAVVDPVTVVLPYETASSVLAKARSISIRDCECRVTYHTCKKPLKTCLALNDFSDDLVDRGVAQEVSLDQARDALKVANAHGLVHQVLYTDWVKGEVFDLCSCCSCCCTYLRALMDFGVKHHIAKSGLVARVNANECVGCGVCLERCVFGARRIENGKAHAIEEKCYGCGLCTSACSAQASRLVPAIA